MNICIYYAAPDFAVWYDPNRLSAADQVRMKQSLDWRTSRAIQNYVQQENGVFSHSHGHALYAVSDVSGSLKTRFGVDLEYVQTREFATWHEQQIISDDELIFLQQSCSPINYYALWTLKESLIKANHGEWADLANVGVMARDGQWCLHAHGVGNWQGAVWQLGEFVIAAVWQDADVFIEWRGLGAWSAEHPREYWRFQAA
ncbi:4'-phosphopantetheinyl transferase superfamily protein [Alysiella crassa]|uniref:4'-phosphopantetheinyl transferase domain-containing protein n=1 Tax=Alysiella crassa TaxID=153491 RepID=A0A376BUA5_9NEIS|nr:4'-phosphopantetheinyl transferase superfamily protein [Alysiella crassa]UOP06115.1 4'-phosphopantetheinyl transferase superfamily protein [Alysiella crassa]SSY80582.1 Uncharacterised protein [Alysiella crassa]